MGPDGAIGRARDVEVETSLGLEFDVVVMFSSVGLLRAHAVSVHG